MSRPATPGAPARAPLLPSIYVVALAAAVLLGAARPAAAIAGGAAEIPYRSLLLIEENGTRCVVDESGEVVHMDLHLTRQVGTLSPDTQDLLRRLLGAAGADRWPAGDATFVRGRSRLVLEQRGGGTRSTPLPSADAGVSRLARILRSFTW